MFGISLLNSFKNKSQEIFRTCTSYLSTASLANIPKMNSFKALPYNKTSGLGLNLLKNKQLEVFTPEVSQNRFSWGYKGRMMLKDLKRREMLRKFAPERFALQTLRANSILPKILRKVAKEQLQKMSKHSALSHVTNRCGFTSKAGGLMHRWRISRHVWRDQADYNHLSGVTMATWGTPSRNAANFTYRGAKRNYFNYDGMRTVQLLGKYGIITKYRFKLN